MKMETQSSISQWAVETFGDNGTNLRCATRVNEEMAELLTLLASDDNHPKAGEECADILIVLFRVASRLGINLLHEVDKKMEINRNRQWRKDGTGHGYHI